MSQQHGCSLAVLLERTVLFTADSIAPVPHCPIGSLQVSICGPPLALPVVVEVSMTSRRLLLMSLLALASPMTALEASAQWWSAGNQPAYREGYDRGVRAGNEDLRRGQTFNVTDEGDYRSADAGYRREYGRIDVYRTEFRRGYQDGYRIGYDQSGYNNRNTPPPWSNGRGYGRGGRWSGGTVYNRYDLAGSNGYGDGYNAGVDDGRDRRRNDPISESRYRSR